MNLNWTSGPGFRISDFSQCVGCLSYGGAGAEDSFKFNSSNNAIFLNCISVNAPRYAFNNGKAISGVDSNRIMNCFVYNPATANFDPAQIDADVILNLVTLSGDPCTNAAGGDFSLNNTAGAGAAVRAVAYPGTFLGTTMTSYLDGGPIQSQAPASGGVGQIMQVRGQTMRVY